jgi:hypothetical protein
MYFIYELTLAQGKFRGLLYGIHRAELTFLVRVNSQSEQNQKFYYMKIPQKLKVKLKIL